MFQKKLKKPKRFVNLTLVNMAIAHLFLKLVPLRCPFAKYLNGFEICKLNPFYPQLMDLRYKVELYIEKNTWMETKKSS
ncbi:MAG: Mo-dependent nitrogenase C-terminal domain-containing protein [Waterburya sp.]